MEMHKNGIKERDFQLKKKTMNNLVLTRKRVIKADRLHKAQIATFKKGVFTSYKRSVFKQRQIRIAEESSSQDS
tara:strand:- start:591 stop:812 length:222 start_codon:yes stop_codon:yes gene_type:complete